MFKKYRQLILGLIIGSLLFTIIPARASVGGFLLQRSEAKLILDNKEFSNKELPVLNYKGYNYIPAATFREITNAMEIGFEWVAPTKEIKISTDKTNAIIGLETQIFKGDDVLETQKIIFGEAMQMIKPNLKFFMNEDKTVDVINSDKKILLKNIPYQTVDNISYIDKAYFDNNIFPLIK